MVRLSSKPQTVRIQSDGTGMDTIVTDMEGNQLQVSEVDISIESRDVVRITLTVYGGVLDIHGQVDQRTLRCPYCAHEETHDCSIPF